MAQQNIYFDNASTTRVDDRVMRALAPYFTKIYCNPSNIYSSGLKTRAAVEKSRQVVARFLGAKPAQIVFTSGGTESNNLAILGSMAKFKKGRIIISAIEHPSVLKPVERLGRRGFEIIKIKPGRDGVVSAREIAKHLTNNTVLVSIMYANNEIGTVQPIAEISRIIRNFRNSKHEALNSKSPLLAGSRRNAGQAQHSQLEIKKFKLGEKAYPLFHTDACQATQYLPLDVQKLGVDMLTINGSKIHAPKGVGALYIKEGIALEPLILGGSQEMMKRAGTENVPLIVGLARALELISNKAAHKTKKISDYLIRELGKIEGAQLNGSRHRRLPSIINFSFNGVEGESLVLRLDARGIMTSTGSACSSESLEPSHVVRAIRDAESAHSSLRISLSRYNTMSEARRAVKIIKEEIIKLRRMSQ